MDKKSPIGKDGAEVQFIQAKNSTLPTPFQSFLSSALALAARGKHIFPLVPKGKKPITQNGLKDASIDPNVIRQWWRKTPDANIGMATGAISGVWVLDIDGEQGENSLKELELKHGQLPPTVEVITGGGGRHLYFLWPQQGIISNSAGRLGQGLDVRGNGGYVVVPPSIHESGRQYTWSVDSSSQVASAPSWLLTMVNKPPERTSTSATEWRELVKGVSEGGRNDALSRLAGKLLRSRLDPYMVLELCLAWNEARCQPPLTNDEVIQTVDSIAGRELARRGVK